MYKHARARLNEYKKKQRKAQNGIRWNFDCVSENLFSRNILFEIFFVHLFRNLSTINFFSNRVVIYTMKNWRLVTFLSVFSNGIR